MRTLTRFVAAMQLALVIPAAVFLTAVLVGTGASPQYNFTRFAHQIVLWYSQRMWTLWFLLLMLPFAALLTGISTLRRNWRRKIEPPQTSPQQSLATLIPAPLATLLIAGTTLTSAGILAVVVLHMLAN